MRMRRNFNFDAHREASFCRDSGSREVARVLNDEYMERLKSQRRQKVPEILDVSDSSVPKGFDDESTQTETFSDAYPLLIFPARRFTIDKARQCTFSLFPSRIELDFCDEPRTQKKVIAARSVKQILLRPYLQKPSAFEIFTEL
jgi:hypothetical protein